MYRAVSDIDRKKQKPGFDSYEAMDELLIRMQAIGAHMFNYITDWLGKDRIYPGTKMRKHFAIVEMKYHGYHKDEF